MTQTIDHSIVNGDIAGQHNFISYDEIDDRLAAAIQLSNDYDEGKSDITLDDHKYMRFNGGDLMVTEPDNPMFGEINPVTIYQVETHALYQFTQKLGVPYQYAVRCPPNLIDSNFNHWLGQIDPGKGAFVRTHDDSVRAYLSSEYSPINNTDVLTIANDIIGGTQYKLLRPYVGRDNIHMRLITNEGMGPEDGNYAIGVYIGNGETGNQRLTVAPFVMRTSCTNSIVYQDGGWRQTHRYFNPAELRALFKMHLVKALKRSDEMLTHVAKAAETEIEDFSAIVQKIEKKHSLSDDQRIAMVVGTEGDKTVMGLVNGVTALARTFERDDPKRALRLENLAAQALITATPNSLFGQAAKQSQQLAMELLEGAEQ